jgi:hypothetical protein
MIHGLSSHTQGAGGAVDYFLDDQYFEAEPTPEDPKSGTWRERDPKPVVLEGDPKQIVALCDSLSFKNRYTSGVMSFSPQETAHIAAHPGMREDILEDFRQFAYAGFKNDDCQPQLSVQHEHTGRLELHYLIPRVSLESGKYFNPFPPNYDGRRGKGSDDIYKKQNDIFTDYICSKYGLQNPRDPKVAREIKISKFDPNKVDKKIITDAVGKLIDQGGIKSREDIVNFLEKAGGTITRKGSDYISVKFDSNQKAIRLKGDYYGEQSYREISDRIERTAERINRPFEEIEREYREILSERAIEVEKIHSLKGLAAEREDEFDRRSTEELKDYANELSATKDSLGDYDESCASVNEYIADNSSLVSLADAASSSNCAIEGGVEISDIGAMITGDPVIDRFNREFNKMRKKLANEDLNRSKSMWKLSPDQEKRLKEIRNWVTNLFAGLSLGRNFFSGSSKPMSPRDIGMAREMITQERRELERELRAVAVVVKQRDRVEPLLEILKPTEPVGHVEAKPEPSPLSPHLAGFIDKTVVLDKKRDIDNVGGIKSLRAGWLSDKVNSVRDEAQFWNKPFDPAAVERAVVAAMAKEKVPPMQAYEAVLKDSGVNRGDVNHAAQVVAQEYTRTALRAEGKPEVGLDDEAHRRFPDVLKRAGRGIDVELKAIDDQMRQDGQDEQKRLDQREAELAEERRLAVEAKRLLEEEDKLKKG